MNTTWDISPENQEMLDKLEIACYALCKKCKTNKYDVTDYDFKSPNDRPAWLVINRSFVNTVRIQPNANTRWLVEAVFGPLYQKDTEWHIPKDWRMT